MNGLMSDAAAQPARPRTGAELAALLGEVALSKRELATLAVSLEQLPEPAALEGRPLEEAAERLQRLVAWLFAAPRSSEGEASATMRLRVLVRALELVPAWSERVSALFSQLAVEVDLVPFFEVGLPNDRGLYEETMDRLARGLLPRPRDANNGRELLAQLLPTLERAEWLSALPQDLIIPLCALLGQDAVRLAPLRQKTEDAIALLATRTSAIGLGRELRERSPACALAASPFYLLPRLCDALFSGLGSTAACFDQIAASREVLRAVLAHLDLYGVSVDVVYRLEVIERNLDRMAELLGVLDAPDLPSSQAVAVALVGRLAAAQVRDRSLRDVVRTNGRLLARKVVERAGSSGDHYITSSRKEWRLMLAAAAGGGLLTVLTTALKYVIVAWHLPLFPEGLFASINYAGSFLLMQALGFALATKQPAMVASSLAGSLKSARGEVDLTELVQLIARICRSQFAAALGNIVFGFAGGIALELAWSFAYGVPFLGAEKARYTLRSLDPIGSGSVIFAAITGVFLWLSSLGAGWLENFAVYRRIPDGIAHHPIGRIVGRSRMARLALRVQHAISGIGGNLSIGFLLGMTPVIGTFFGVPLEVRHVTLSTVSLALSIASSGWLGLAQAGVPRAAIGILVILLFNFGVSFSLALWVAMRARGVRNQGLRLVRALLKRFYIAPLYFLLPPREPKGQRQPE